MAVDDKTMRGARQGQASALHFLSALDHATGTVLTQQRVAGKSNEVPIILLVVPGGRCRGLGQLLWGTGVLPLSSNDPGGRKSPAVAGRW